MSTQVDIDALAGMLSALGIEKRFLRSPESPMKLVVGLNPGLGEIELGGNLLIPKWGKLSILPDDVTIRLRAIVSLTNTQLKGLIPLVCWFMTEISLPSLDPPVCLLFDSAVQQLILQTECRTDDDCFPEILREMVMGIGKITEIVISLYKSSSEWWIGWKAINSVSD